MSRHFVIPDSLRQMQAKASDHRASVWVSANAGSGKTHVLTQRVLRLLLAGAPPGQILGLTFTKAAAANMATRIFTTLAEWTCLSDEALTTAIAETGAKISGLQDLIFARQLFARTIETPGGLKIQTLHAFCERLLQLFPFEANVPAHFRVIDEREANALMQQARNRAIAAIKTSPASEALDLVAREAGVFGFNELLTEARSSSQIFDAFHDAPAFAAALRAQLGLAPGLTTASVEAEMLGGDAGRKQREVWTQGLDTGTTNDRKLAAKLRAANVSASAQDQIRALLEAFFVKDGRGRPRSEAEGRIATVGLGERMPALEDSLLQEQTRLTALRDRWRAAQTLERTEALFAVAKAILTAFADAKADRGELDFPDQIAGALSLVTRSSAAWVLQKLDSRLDHLLIDEAQDTSPEQWRILSALTEEFFAGEGARTSYRTVFAVGDEKQSIFSFQGAAPEKFAEMRRYFEKRCREAEQRFEIVPLNFSFRSAPAILEAVDNTFRSDEAWLGLAAAGEPPPMHQAVRSAMKGAVELWPTLRPAPAPDPEDWRMPLDELSHGDPAAMLARRIAQTIEKWLSPDSRERIVDEKSGLPRRIRPGDVMILVRSRNAFFEAMIRALKERNVKVAGADRLMLRDHIAVMDLVAAGRAALSPDDDLTLACVLKSPLIGLDEDDLFALAAKRRGSLAASLGERTRDAPRVLNTWRARAKDLSPYAFYARLLGEDGGRRALLGRLGPDAADPIDEFLAAALAHEQSEAPSLHLFLAEVEAADAAIKRDMEGGSEGVRVLTVHASKGLEAPVVFLPDTCGEPDGRNDPKLLRLASNWRKDPPLFAWSRKKDEDCEVLAAARTGRRKAEAGEHRRLLYVAMTRAAQRLIIAGYETSKGRGDGCWHRLVEVGLGASMTDAPAPWDSAETIRRFGEGLRADDGGGTLQASALAHVPAWLSAKAAPEAPGLRLTPSRTSRAQESDRVLEGRLAHALLQILPDVAPEHRAAAAAAYLNAHGGALGAAAREALSDQIVSAVAAPELAALFGPGSRGEVSLAGVLRRPDRPSAPYSGRLDRVLVTEAGVSIVDFKLGAAPMLPSPVHIVQLALYREVLRSLYPRLPVLAALVYLEGPTIRAIETAELDGALDAFDAS